MRRPVRADDRAADGGHETTYRALAAKTELSAGYLNHLVHGNRALPSNDVIETLARALDVEPEHFREYRLRKLTTQLESMWELADRLYRRLVRWVGVAEKPRAAAFRDIKLVGALEPEKGFFLIGNDPVVKRRPRG